eukprot:Gb_32403 [translate_table: standard]
MEIVPGRWPRFGLGSGIPLLKLLVEDLGELVYAWELPGVVGNAWNGEPGRSIAIGSICIWDKFIFLATRRPVDCMEMLLEFLRNPGYRLSIVMGLQQLQTCFYSVRVFVTLCGSCLILLQGFEVERKTTVGYGEETLACWFMTIKEDGRPSWKEETIIGVSERAFSGLRWREYPFDRGQAWCNNSNRGFHGDSKRRREFELVLKMHRCIDVEFESMMQQRRTSQIDHRIVERIRTVAAVAEQSRTCMQVRCQS